MRKGGGEGGLEVEKIAPLLPRTLVREIPVGPGRGLAIA